MELDLILQRLLAKQELSAQEVTGVLEVLTQGQADPVKMAAVLTAWRAKGETPGELSTACQWLRQRMVRVDTSGLAVVDTCGTGGDEQGTFNVSTAAALVAAACGVPVVKHGNRGISSLSGSADVLERLGVRIELSAEEASACLRQTGFAFCLAPRFHPVLARVADLRRRLGFRTVFNLLGPLLNPAQARWQLLGVAKPELLDLLALTLARLGDSQALVIHGCDGLDEITLSGPTLVRKVANGVVEADVWYPETFDLPRYPTEAFRVANAEHSAQLVRSVLAGEQTPARDLVLANAAATLYLCGHVSRLVDGVRVAAQALDSGAALRLLNSLVEVTNRSLAQNW
ncbi:MAG: anthranilate phosphoribosyltransferase [Gemmatales bacterium]|nr:anthranilate phosphoribosyltransferase [Gemmatales bacterium]MDW7995804.1 anthranilate phosphoribosyltransferase [Gemmatales bacterium]